MDGPLRYYPSRSDSTGINVIHLTDLDDLLDYSNMCILPGATNIVWPDSSPYAAFLVSAFGTILRMVTKMFDLANDPGASTSDYHKTKIRFLIHRDDDYDPDTETDAERIQARQDMQELNDTLESHFQADDRDLFGWDDFKAVWIQDYPACPACEPEEYEKMKHLISI
jgi:hypothetical protein